MARLRLNITALIGEDCLGKFLVVVDAGQGLDHLHHKVQSTLRNSGVRATVEKVLNTSRHLLPRDEVLGDMLRDGEELVVVLRGVHNERLHERRLHEHAMHDGSGVVSLPPTMPRTGPTGSPGRAIAVMEQPVVQESAPVPLMGGGVSVPFSALIRMPKEPEAPAKEEPEYPPSEDFIAKGAPLGALPVPGPAEVFEECGADAIVNSTLLQLANVDHPCEAIAPRTYDNDWLVENMTPKLRDFLWEHRGEVTQEPHFVKSIGKYVSSRFHQRSGHFVTVFMRPQTGNGSDANLTIPTHYNVAKCDVLNFQRRAQQHMVKAQDHLEMFAATKKGLRALLSKGMSEDDSVDVMLPLAYDSLQDAEGLMVEADKPLFPKVAGRCPVIVVDTSGAAGNHLPYIKASLKRALAALIAGVKDSFQLIGFSATTGDVKMWAKGMQTPTNEALRQAEAWIEALKPSTATCRLLNAVRYAVAHDEADTIYLLSSAEAEKNELGRQSIVNGIRSLNARELAIHTIGIQPDCEAEMLLRSIAESNWGDFVHKSFREPESKSSCSTADVRWTAWRTHLVNERSNKLSDSFKKQKMSIGGQMKIIDVMEVEEREREQLWLEEWKCAQRLLASALRQRDDITDSDTLRELERSGSRTLKVRVGGGFEYAQDEVDLGLDQLFERRSAQPWTDRALTAAAGPAMLSSTMKVVEPETARAPRLPPARHPPPEGALPLPERRHHRPDSARRRTSSTRKTPTNAGKPPTNPSQTTSIGSLDGSRRAKVSPSGTDSTMRPPSASSRGRVASADKAAGGGQRPPSASRRTSSRSRQSKSPAGTTSSVSKLPAAVPTTTAFKAAADAPTVAVIQDEPAALPVVDPQGALDRRWSF